MGIKLLVLFLIFFAITPNLGFFTTFSFLILLFVIIFYIGILHSKKLFSLYYLFEKPFESYIPLTSLLIIFYSLIYYGGLYQNPKSIFFGQILIVLLCAYLFLEFFLFRKRLSIFIILAFYLVIAVWTIVQSPKPYVDTIVVLKEAPLKFIQGENPYNTMYTRVYQNIKPNYYNYLPFSFIYTLPFIFIFSDPRYLLILANIISALILYCFAHKNRYETVCIFLIAVLLFLPRSFYMLEHIYLDQLIFSLFLIFLYLYKNNMYSRAFIILGTFYLIKQPILLTLPLLILSRSFRARLKKYIFFFLLPFSTVAYFLVRDPIPFLNNILLNLRPAQITSPIHISLTTQTFVKNYFSFPIVLNILPFLCMGIFLYLYVRLIRSSFTIGLKISLAFFFFNFFMYHAFFNNYYLVMQFFLLDIFMHYRFVKEKTTAIV